MEGGAGLHSCLHCGLPVPAARGDRFCCFGCRFVHRLAEPGTEQEALGGEKGAGPSSTLLLRLGLGIFLTLNIMAVSWGSYSQEVFGAKATAAEGYSSLTTLFSFLALFLCTGVVVLLGLPMIEDALLRAGPGGKSRLRTVFTGGATTQLLVVVGVLSAYGLSVINTLRGEGSLFFDTAATVLVVVSLGSFLEARAKRRATLAAGRLLTPLPERLLVRREGGLQEIATEDLRQEDLVRVLPGDCVAFDGIVVEGRTHLDEARLVGEPRPRPAEPGSRLLAGTVNLDGMIWARALRVGAETVLAETQRTLEKARGEQPPIQRAADRVAAVFVPTVTILALAVLVARAAAGDVAGGIFRALSVLLISCPCALGLAAPLATWNALKRAADRGILVDRASTLERAAALRRLYFDKTGTLTEPRLRLGRIEVAQGISSDQAFRWAAALESASPHPIARAFLRSQPKESDPGLQPTAARIVPGLGVEGMIDGRALNLGSPAWAKVLGVANPLPEEVGREKPGPEQPGLKKEGSRSRVLLMDQSQVLARFSLEEALRPEAVTAVERLRASGLELGILSGDRASAARKVGDLLGIVGRGDLLPKDKVTALAEGRRSARGGVAMVGDGINDAPVLAAADVGIALGSASELARRSGNVRLLGDDLGRVPLLLAIARDTQRRIRANLAWAFGFNSTGILLAAAGLLNPVFSALAMVSSSLIVVWISSRAGLVASRAPGTLEDQEQSPRPSPTQSEAGLLSPVGQPAQVRS